MKNIGHTNPGGNKNGTSKFETTFQINILEQYTVYRVYGAF